IPPGPAARAAAVQLRQRLAATGDGAVVETPTTTSDSTIIDLSVYERAAQQRTIK
ncbi:MAG TPA: IS21 family transposase, partial [Mycobacterium sp.]|nr:IS21 family transposase [Mycobacterium sp.]